ncbi:hypothetical protein BDV29DRAFT_187139 [Aspergillus leporis]|uniref:Uncharacterized protein n=1 Tax=Aspergillus leporis TaxID=41062 RepID=A0A5N5XIZ9_9EURO|nr:hypothetical protein BDV29DRAFT_187139 [Aspergillus leporis]
MVPRFRPVGPDNKSESDVRSNVTEIFSDNGSGSESNSDMELNSDDSDDDKDPNDNSIDDKGQLPPEDYLAEAESLDISQLQQQYCWHISIDLVQHWQWISDSDKTCGKNKQYYLGIGHNNLLKLFWKWWHLILKQEVVLLDLNKDTIIKIYNVSHQSHTHFTIIIVTEQKELELTQQLKQNMYIKNNTKFVHMLLTTTMMTFDYGWLWIQLLFFCQLAAITVSYPKGGRLKLFIFLKLKCIMKFLNRNKFKILVIIFDPTLVLGLCICLLGMLFHIKGFKIISTTWLVQDCSENLYNLQAVWEAMGYQITLEKAKAFNSSEEITNTLQNIMLQHADICIISIDSDQPYKLSTEESKLLNKLPEICAWQERDWTVEAKQRYNKSVCELCNKKQQQQNWWIQENLEWYKNKQPIINLELQLAGKLVDTKIMESLEHKGFMFPQHLISASDNDNSGPPAKQQQDSGDNKIEIVLHQAIKSICLLCVRDLKLPWAKWMAKHAIPGSLIRHFL